MRNQAHMNFRKPFQFLFYTFFDLFLVTYINFKKISRVDLWFTGKENYVLQLPKRYICVLIQNHFKNIIEGIIIILED